MVLCAFGPLPMLLLGNADGVQAFQYFVYMAIAISLSTVLRAFMARTLFAQFRLERQLREQANTDGLTGLLLRNRFLELARLALSDIRRQQRPVCMLFLDADHFKQLNDDYGHAAGDAALIALAAALRAQMRLNDLIGRIGGEEFAILLPGLDLQQASQRAEQLRLAVRAILRPDGPLTVSIGVAECDHAGENTESLLARADLAMRQAKHDGRDRIVSAPGY
jgi:diguanylate cyclase (GGDEF)-like protein